LDTPPADPAPLLSAAELALYRRIADHLAEHKQNEQAYGERPAPPLPLRLDPDDPALCRLLGLGLLRPEPGSPGGYAICDPEPVGQRAVAEARARAARHQREALSALAEAEELPTSFQEFSAVYARSHPAPARAEGYQILEGFDRINARIKELVDGARLEVLTAQPGRRSRGILEVSRARDLPAVRRGVSFRNLYHAEALASEHVLAFLAETSEHGYRTRVLDTPFQRLVVVDRAHAVIPVLGPHSTRLEPDYLLAFTTSVPAMVGWILDGFEQDWAAAVDVSALHRPGEAGSAARQRRHRILRLLREGESHEAIARRLELSVRTVRNYVQEDREALDAKSLYQHGYRAALRDRLEER
jgi:hypothetical protein